MLHKFASLLKVGLSAILLSASVASATLAAPPDGLTAEQVSTLEQRVRERWQALATRDYARAWEFATPVYRGIFPKELYVLQFSYAVELGLTGVEVVNYDAPAAVASVAARVMSRPAKQTSTASMSAGALPITVNEKWVNIDGKWWHSAND